MVVRFLAEGPAALLFGLVRCRVTERSMVNAAMLAAITRDDLVVVLLVLAIVAVALYIVRR